jgi:hypothetical protein
MSLSSGFAFCIPLIARENAHNWTRVVENLQGTLQSMLNQLDPEFLIFIASNDALEIPEISDPRVTVFPMPPDRLVGKAEFNYFAGNSDATLKRQFLTEKAREAQCKFVMYCDADDLVSSKIVQFVKKTNHSVGYAVCKGYVMDGETGLCVHCPSEAAPVKSFDTFCGTSIIITLSDNFTGEIEKPLELLITRGHLEVRTGLIDIGQPMFDIVHPSVIYLTNHGANISDLQSNKKIYRDFAAQVSDNVQGRGQPLSRELLMEYGMLARSMSD